MALYMFNRQLMFINYENKPICVDHIRGKAYHCSYRDLYWVDEDKVFCNDKVIYQHPLLIGARQLLCTNRRIITITEDYTIRVFNTAHGSVQDFGQPNPNIRIITDIGHCRILKPDDVYKFDSRRFDFSDYNGETILYQYISRDIEFDFSGPRHDLKFYPVNEYLETIYDLTHIIDKNDQFLLNCYNGCTSIRQYDSIPYFIPDGSYLYDPTQDQPQIKSARS